jgi:hypothetical protein
VKSIDWLNAAKPGTISVVSLSRAMRRDWVRDVAVHSGSSRSQRRERDSDDRRLARQEHRASVRTDWSGCATWKNGHLIRRSPLAAATS